MKDKIAIVTGANRGIGFEIARQLALSGVTVVLTARDEAKGKAACDKLRQQGLNVRFHQLDVTNEKSVLSLAEDLRLEFGKIDILVNNAGIGIDEGKSTLNIDMDTVRKTMETNFYGPFQVSQALIGLMQRSQDGRIVNISSGMGALHSMGRGSPSYSISKTALNALTAKMASDLNDTHIKVNAMCPGWVRTDMGGPNASRDVQQGAETAVWLATSDDVPTGKYLRDKKEIEW